MLALAPPQSSMSPLQTMESGLYPSVIELTEEIMKSLSSESMSLSLEDATQLSDLTKAVRMDIKVKFRTGKFAVAETFRQHKEWIARLHKSFIKLVNKLDESLQKMGNFALHKEDGEVISEFKEWSNVLIVLSSCRRLAKVYFGGIDLLVNVLLARGVALNALISHARRDVDYHWLLEHKDALDSKAKRSLGMMLFPPVVVDGTHYDLVIDRTELLAESLKYFGQVKANKLHGGISIQFKDEEAMGPGVLKEWLFLLCQEIFSPQKLLFSPCPYDRTRFFLNPASPRDPVHLEYFRFAGRIVSFALIHEYQLGVTFDRSLFSQLTLDSDVFDLEDIQESDPILYSSCKEILEMDDEFLNSNALGLTFAREVEEFGVRRTIELDFGGSSVVIGSHNKEEFIASLTYNYFCDPVKEQIRHLCQGFSDFCYQAKFGSLFFESLDSQDLDRMLRGSGIKINVHDWKAHTIYDGYSDEDQQIIFFWKIVEEMQEEEKKALLHFWTNIKFLPFEGFCGLDSKLYLCNTFDTGECLPLPKSLTCFRQLLLPPYLSMSIMQNKLQFITQDLLNCTFR